MSARPSTVLVFAATLLAASTLRAAVVYEVTSPYHHIRVIDNSGIRTLYFDNSPQTQMGLANPLLGHFEYTELFHLAWLWNGQLTNVLMIGLGGGSAQRAFTAYYPSVVVHTVEIDPLVVQVASNYFRFRESDRQKVFVSDGRVFLRRNQTPYDLIILDAYVQSRYGAAIPQHLATKEFFELARQDLSTNGVLAYNIIGTLGGWHADIIGAIYRTLNSVFPQVYVFTARSSQNVVLLATQTPTRTPMTSLRQRADWLMQNRRVTLPTFRQRLETLQASPPANLARSPVLTDDYAPVEGLTGGTSGG